MSDGYAHDVFFSYVSTGGGTPAHTQFHREWARNILLPVLIEELAAVRAHKLTVYSDRDNHVGTHWPDALRDALARSRVMVAVWSPPYFRTESAWCRWEFGSMLDRSTQAGQRLILPIVMRDGKEFPPDARVFIGDERFKDLAVDLTTPVSGVFRAAVMDFAEQVARACDASPEWRPDFPVREQPPVDARPAFEQFR